MWARQAHLSVALWGLWGHREEQNWSLPSGHHGLAFSPELILRFISTFIWPMSCPPREDKKTAEYVRRQLKQHQHSRWYPLSQLFWGPGLFQKQWKELWARGERSVLFSALLRNSYEYKPHSFMAASMTDMKGLARQSTKGLHHWRVIDIPVAHKLSARDSSSYHHKLTYWHNVPKKMQKLHSSL